METNNREILPEILENILRFVPKKDRKNHCRLVNKTFNDVVGFLDDQESFLCVKYEHIVSWRFSWAIQIKKIFK